MAVVVGRAVLGGVALAALLCAGETASAQTELPEIIVEAPSPVVRARPRTARPAPAAPAPLPPAAPAPPAPETPPPGVLPIVTDQFATVTVVPREELRRTPGGTLGDVLFSKPGITGSSFAPGAASRPIVRGLDTYRVRVQENGIGSSGVSELGEDHAVPLDPLAADRIEVVRGPATLRWGSQAIGGVVNASNNRIPDASPCPTVSRRAASDFPSRPTAPPWRDRACDWRRRGGVHAAWITASMASSCLTPAPAISPSMPTPSAGAATTTAFRAIRICRRATRRCRSTAGSRIRPCAPTANPSAAHICSRAASSASR